MIDADLERSLKHHFDGMAASAPPSAPSGVSSARRAGDRSRRRAALTAGGVFGAAIVATFAVTQWVAGPDEAPTVASDPKVRVGTTVPSADRGNAWTDMPAAAGAAWEVEHYTSVSELLNAAPVVVRGTVTAADAVPGSSGGVVDGQRVSDLLLTVDVNATTGKLSDRSVLDQVVIQLGPFFADEAQDWVTAASTEPGAIIGADTVWALRHRADAPTYRPLTSDAVYARSGDAVLTPLAIDTEVTREATGMTWRELLESAGMPDH